MTATKTRALGGDNSGAIMVLGIFMACAMVAMMWYLVGIGDAVIWRDRSQEAADAIAFSSASVHARGMNFIAFLNIVMLVLAAIYLITAVIYSILDVALVINGRDDDCPFGSWCDGCAYWDFSSATFRDDVKDLLELVVAVLTGGSTAGDIGKDEFCKIAGVLEPIHDRLGPTTGHGSSSMLIKKFEDNVMATVMPPAAKLQTRIAQLAPYAGALTGAYLGSKYEDGGKSRYGIALSPSMVPASVLNGYLKSKTQKSSLWAWTEGDPRLGLPVGEMPMGKLCSKATTYLPGLVAAKLNMGFLSDIINSVIGTLGDQVQAWYCEPDADGPAAFNIANVSLMPLNWFWGLRMSNVRGGTSAPKYDFPYKGGSFWGKKESGGLAPDTDAGGPKWMVEYAENGNDWMQVYGLVFGFNRVEKAENLTSVAGGGGSLGASSGSAAISMLDEAANVYFTMSEFYLDCDAKWDDFACSKDSNATFQMKWRARLRRVHKPAWGEDLLGYVGKGIIGDRAKDLLQDKVFGEALGELDKWKGALGKKSAFSSVFDILKGGALGKAGHYLDSDTVAPDVIH